MHRTIPALIIEVTEITGIAAVCGFTLEVYFLRTGVAFISMTAGIIRELHLRWGQRKPKSDQQKRSEGDALQCRHQEHEVVAKQKLD